MSFTLCSSAAIVIKAGANASSTAKASGAILQQFSDEAEDFINAATRYDWVTNWGSASGSLVANAVADATACIAATSLIAYDMSAYKSINENLINVLYDRAGRVIEYLKAYKKPEETA